METRKFPDDVAEYLRLHHVITLGTSSFTGMPHADTVVYANDEWRLYFFGLEGSTIARNVQSSRYIVFTIDDYTTDWRKVRELQGVGRCQPADTTEEEWAIWLCSQKFGPAFARPPGVLYRVLPGEMHFVDYDYATVAALTPPEITERTFRFDDGAIPQRGAVSTSLDQTVFEPGQVDLSTGATGRASTSSSSRVKSKSAPRGTAQTRPSLGSALGSCSVIKALLHGQRGVFTAHAVTRTVLLAVQRETMRDLLLTPEPRPLPPPPKPA